jgi:predicted RNase H-like HicB family nuclease
MSRAYIALLRKDGTSDYGVEFPDFPGCVTAGSTLEEARRMAAEALAGHIDRMIEAGEAVPEPSELDAIMADADTAGAVAFLVPAPERQPRAVRVNITLPEDVLAAIDAYAEAHGQTRSGFIAAASKKAIATAA